MADSRPPEAKPVAWGLLLVPAVAQCLLLLSTSGNFGVFRDEYYYLACAERLAWGYVDQPPLSIWLLAGWTWLFGDSVHSIRILPALCGAGTVLLTGATAARLGGGRWAQLLAGVGVAVNAGLLTIGGFYSMNAYSFLFWLAAYYLVIQVARTGDGKVWLAFGVVVGLGLFNKIGLLVLGAALAIGLVVTQHRRQLADWRLYAGGALALAFLSPYAIWNQLHDWPALEFIANAKAGKIVSFSPLEYLIENILSANPLTVPLWVAGLAWLLLARSGRRYRIVAVMFLATYVLLVLQRSKPYYFATSFPVLFAAGGVAWEQWTNAARRPWARWALVSLLVVGGVVIAPMAVPLLSPEGTLAWYQRLGVMPKPQEHSHTSPLPQILSDRFGWKNLAREVAQVYAELPVETRHRTIVVGQNYGHAGAIEYWSREYDLPPAFSTHNNYWLWGPPPDDTAALIVIRGNPETLGELCEEVTEVAVAETPEALESLMRIWLCAGLRRPLSEVWNEYKSFG
jgi:hypothetical protein